MRWKPKIEPFSWLVWLLSAYCTRPSMRFWPKIGEWGDTCGGRRWKKYHPGRSPGIPAAPPKRPQIGAAGCYDWYIGTHCKAGKRPYMGIFGLLWLRYTTCHTTRRANTWAGKEGSTEAGSTGRILFYTKYYTTQSICKPRHPHQATHAAPGRARWIIA